MDCFLQEMGFVSPYSDPCIYLLHSRVENRHGLTIATHGDFSEGIGLHVLPETIFDVLHLTGGALAVVRTIAMVLLKWGLMIWIDEGDSQFT